MPVVTTDETEQVYQNERFGRTITAERRFVDRGLDTLAVHVEDDDQDATVELTLEELADLSRGVGNSPRRPPRRDLMGTIEGHYEIIDHGDLVTVDTPTARFKISRSVAESTCPWIVTEHDEGHSWKVTDGLTRNAALVDLLERLGLVWNDD